MEGYDHWMRSLPEFNGCARANEAKRAMTMVLKGYMMQGKCRETLSRGPGIVLCLQRNQMTATVDVAGIPVFGTARDVIPE